MNSKLYRASNIVFYNTESISENAAVAIAEEFEVCQAQVFPEDMADMQCNGVLYFENAAVADTVLKLFAKHFGVKEEA